MPLSYAVVLNDTLGDNPRLSWKTGKGSELRNAALERRSANLPRPIGAAQRSSLPMPFDLVVRISRAIVASLALLAAQPIAAHNVDPLEFAPRAPAHAAPI